MDTESEPGKFVPVNRTDEDGDGIPDYADIEVPGQKALIPTLLVLKPEELDWEQLNIRVSYDGDKEPPDLTNLNPTDILHKSQSSGFTNYLVTIQDAKPLRLWGIEEASDSRATEKYVVPDKIQHIIDFKEEFEGEGPLWLEGLHEISDLLTFEVTAISAIDEKHVLTETKVRANVFEAKLGLNTSNDHQDNRLRPGIPDVEFIIDDDDAMVKDQGDGFTWWWGRSMGPQVTHSGIVDLFPVAVNIPKTLLDAGFEPYMSHDGDGSLVLYPAPELTPQDRRAHLKNPGAGERQLSQSPYPVRTVPMPIPVTKGDDWEEFLMRVIGSGESTFTVTLWLRDKGGNDIPADSWRVKIKDTERYWTFLSTRGEASIPFVYPTEADRAVEIMRYPDPAPVSGHPGRLDPNKTKQIVWIHGMNVRVNEAQEELNELYKRLFWLGYRGNFIGLTWDGDSPRAGGNPALPHRFDPTVAQAFQTAPSVMRMLGAFSARWGADNIHVGAHSLGNLVMFDALRLQERVGGSPIARNVFSAQAALWRESFEPQSGVAYQSPSDPIEYTEDQLQLQSWAFWFNQRGRHLSAAVSGGIYHSYSDTDRALEYAMRLNDMTWRGRFRSWHYYRNLLEAIEDDEGLLVYRAPVGEKALHNRAPALLRQPDGRIREYDKEQLNVPIGAVARNPLATENANARDFGWRQNKHSDHIMVEIGADEGNAWFPEIWHWYDKFLGDHRYDGLPSQAPRIPLGEE